MKKITQITTRRDPHPKQIVYGEQALDLVFGELGVGNFDLAAFFGEERPNCITTNSTISMIKTQLISLFGHDPQFTEEMAKKMKEKMLEDLHYGRNEEYMSKAGISVLFSCSGGKFTPEMNDALMKTKTKAPAEICAL